MELTKREAWTLIQEKAGRFSDGNYFLCNLIDGAGEIHYDLAVEMKDDLFRVFAPGESKSNVIWLSPSPLRMVGIGLMIRLAEMEEARLAGFKDDYRTPRWDSRLGLIVEPEPEQELEPLEIESLWED